jgi:hypothetical protein
MKYRDTAISAVADAQQSLVERLREIATEALHAEAYAEVAAIAELTAKVSTALKSLHHTETPVIQETAYSEPVQPEVAVPQESHRSTPNGNGSAPIKTKLPNRSSAYPLFFRDGDLLVKVAWSKKERKPYEHRAPFAVVETLLATVQKKWDRKVFQATNLIPLRNGPYDQYPSYQCYLALLWLRQLNVVGKRGREGYFLRPKATTPDKLRALWMNLPSIETIEL